MAGDSQTELKFLMTFDAQTGALKVVRQELDEAGKAAGDSQRKVEGMGGSFGELGKAVKLVSIGSFMLDAVKSAAGASDAFDDLTKTWHETIGVLVRQFEPAISLVSRGLQGLLILVQGMAGAIKAAFSGEFAKSLELAGDAISAAGERAQGITRSVEQDISKIIIEETRNRIAQAGISAEEKLRIIQDGETRALDALKKSAEWQIMDEEKRALAVLDVRNSFLRQRKSAEEQAAKELVELQKIHLDESLALLSEGLDDALRALGASNEERYAAIDEAMVSERELVDAARADGTLKAAEYEAAKSKIAEAGRKARAAIVRDEAKDVFETGQNKARAVLAVESALANRLIDLAYQLGEKHKLNAKEVAKELIKTVAQAAAAQIMAHFATGAAKEVATKGVAGLIPAAVLLAEGAALAMSVAALGGAAAGSIHTGSGGGGGGGGSEGGGAPAGSGAEGGGPFAQQPGAAGLGYTGPSTVVSVQLLDGTLAPQAAKSIGEELAKQNRQEGR